MIGASLKRTVVEAIRVQGMNKTMQVPSKFKTVALIVALLAVAALIAACGGSKANVRKDDTAATPKVVEVSTAAAISRELPQFFEATGSLAGDEQTDVAPQTSG